MLAFLSNWLAAYAGDKYPYADNLLGLDYNNKDFFLPWKYFSKFFEVHNARENYFKDIASLLNKLYYNNREKSNATVKKLISIPDSYSKRARQFGLLSFQGDDYFSDEFKEWERFVDNYSKNSVNDKESFFAYVKRIREDFANYSTDILTHLASRYKNIDKERNMQLREEYFKATVLLGNNHKLSANIRKAETHQMLNGRLRPLLIDGKKFDETKFPTIWSSFLATFGDDGTALSFKEKDESSLSARARFARAFTKRIVRRDQLFNGWRVLDFAENTLKEKLQWEDFNQIFRDCLLSDNLDDIKELECEDVNDIEFIQAKEVLLQPGVIEGILKCDIGSSLRFNWYAGKFWYLYPKNSKKPEKWIGIDYVNSDPVWQRNRNHTLDKLKKKLYDIVATPVSENNPVALWWGCDIRFHHPKHPDITLCWYWNYDIGIINEKNQWIKRRDPSESGDSNFMFHAVGLKEDDIAEKIETLIDEFLKEQPPAEGE